MKIGIIMEMDEGLLTVLTPDGEFLHAKKQDRPYAIGEEISFSPIENSVKPKTVSRFFRLKPILALSAAVFVSFGSLFPLYQSNHAYAYMSIDVNPSIELGINKNMKVVELTAFNKEGKQIISLLKDWKKKDVTEITETIMAEMEKEGYLEVNKQLIISTVRTEGAEKQIEKQLEANIKEIKAAATQQQLELMVVSGTKEDLEKAHQLGLTTGKYQAKNRQKGNGKEKANNNRESKQELQPDAKVPPGQLKKQERANRQIEGAVETAPQAGNEQNDRIGNWIPPGQQKKMEEQAAENQNNAQIKKHQHQNWNPDQIKKQQHQKWSPGQLKKQQNPTSSPDHANKQPHNKNRNNKYK